MATAKLDALALEFMRLDLISFVRGMKIPGVPVSKSGRDLLDGYEPLSSPVDFSAHHLLWLNLLQQVESANSSG